MAMRIDKLLWFLRFTRTRGIAQAMVGAGHIRLNGRRIERAHQGVAIGDVLVLPLPSGVRVVEVLALPERRGPACEAQSCYRALDEPRLNPLAAEPIATMAEGDFQP
jgi:ribosome-associated heat shock protein Hsp15